MAFASQDISHEIEGELMDAFLQALPTTVATAFLAAWLTARFAFGRFRDEKVWERKIAAYAAFFDALHDMEKWYDENFDAVIQSRDLGEEREKALGDTYDTAKAALRRRMEVEAWLLSASTQAVLDQMFRSLSAHHVDWFEMLDNNLNALHQAKQRLRLEAQRELHPSWRSLLPQGIDRWKRLRSTNERASGPDPARP